MGVASFPHLAEPDTGGKYSDDKYKITIIFDGDEDLSGLEAVVKEAAKEEFDGKLPKTLKMPIKDGDEKEKEEYHGKLLVTAKSKFPATTVDRNKDELDPSKIRGGDKVRISVRVGAMRISGTPTGFLNLRAVQLIEAGDRGSYANDFDDEYAGDDAAGGDDSAADGTDF